MSATSKRKGDPLTKDDYDRLAEEARDNNDDNNDDDDRYGPSVDHSQPFGRASEAVLQTRKIVRAKRPMGTAKDHDTAMASNKPANPFASVSLVAAAPAAASVSTKEATTTTAMTTIEENSATNDDTVTTTAGDAAAAGTDSPKKASIFGAAAPFSGFAAAIGSSKSGFGAATGSGFGSSISAAAAGSAFGSRAATTTTTTTTETPKCVFGSGASFSGFAAAAAKPAFESVTGGFSLTGFGSSSTNPATAPTIAPSNSAEGVSFAFATNSSTKSNTTTTTNNNATTPASPVAKLPQHYEATTGEEDERCVLELRCKTWRRGPDRLAVASSTGHTSSSSNNSNNSPNSGAATTTHASVPPSQTSQSILRGTTTTPAATATKSEAATDHDSKTEKDATDDLKANPTSEDDKESDETKSTDKPSTNDTKASPSTTSPKPSAVIPQKWHEVGKGPLKVLQHATHQTTRLVQRRESTPGGPATLVIVNVRLTPQISVVTQPSESHVQLVTLRAPPDPPDTHLFKCGKMADAADLFQRLSSIVTAATAVEDATTNVNAENIVTTTEPGEAKEAAE